MAEKRKNIPQKLRFEVFKRDNFTCQYCGRKSPDVVLEVDHINPVNNGGKNDILNLVTSCFDCNRGKGKKKLSDHSEIEKQMNELELMNERRKQIEMLIQWRKELRNIINEEVDSIAEIFTDNSGFELSENDRKTIHRLLHEFDYNIVSEAAEIACFQYVKYGRDYTLSNAFKKLGGICYNLKNGRGK